MMSLICCIVFPPILKDWGAKAIARLVLDLVFVGSSSAWKESALNPEVSWKPDVFSSSVSGAL